MTEKQFIESQKECASLLGISLEEYLVFCEDVRVSKEEIDRLKNIDLEIIKENIIIS